MSASENRELIDRFYAAFARRDAETMARCYDARARFRDPVFELEGARIGAMWKMLCARGADLRIEYSVIAADDTHGSAHWQAWYTFSGSGRPVHNVIEARFRFAGGLIVEHVDAFDFWRWSRQALGLPGVLLGWSPLLRAKVRTQALQALARFES